MARTTFSNGAMKEKQGPTFFKIIKTDFNTEELRIPPKFWKNLLNELSDSAATLNVKESPNSPWIVEVSQTEGEIYFKNGWQTFIKDNSLGDFEFLVFRYEGDMQFCIEIFDRRQCKRIKFPDVRTDREAAGMHKQTYQSNKLKEEEEEYQDSREEEEAAMLPDLDSRSFTRNIGKNMYNEALPTDFSAKYFPPGYYTIVLKNSRGEKWNVNVVPNGSVKRTVKLSSGWKEFRRDNKINCGDTCIFEVVGSKTMVVHIDRK